MTSVAPRIAIRRLALINGILLLLAAVLLAPRWLISGTEIAAQSATCVLSEQPCGIELASGNRLQLDLGSKQLAPPQRLEITLSFSKPVQQAYWQFNGKEMPMYLAEEAMQQLSETHFSLSTQLALCITDPDMRWQSWLRILSEQGTELIKIDLINPSDAI